MATSDNVAPFLSAAADVERDMNGQLFRRDLKAGDLFKMIKGGSDFRVAADGVNDEVHWVEHTFDAWIRQSIPAPQDWPVHDVVRAAPAPGTGDSDPEIRPSRQFASPPPITDRAARMAGLSQSGLTSALQGNHDPATLRPGETRHTEVITRGEASAEWSRRVRVGLAAKDDAKRVEVVCQPNWVDD